MGIRDWLAIIVIVFIVLILLDGFRRKWLERKNRIRVKLDKNIPKVEGEEDNDVIVKTELPNGGARIKTRSGEEVPVLVDSVDIDDEDIEEYTAPTAESNDDVDFGEFEDSDETDQDWTDEAQVEEDEEYDDVGEDADDGEDEEPAQTATLDDDIEEDDFESVYEEADDDELPDNDSNNDINSDVAKDDPRNDVGTDDITEQQSIPQPAAKEKGASGKGRRQGRDDRIEPTFGDSDMTFGRDDQGELNLEHHDLFEHEDDDATGIADDSDEQAQAEEVIVINVMARPGMAIEGRRMLPILLKHGMRLGDMSIFHRHADSTGKGPVMFSMANMLRPGTFSISEMETFTTPGVSFFMQLPNKVGNMQCFDQMLKTAQAVKDELDASLKDENRSVFTRQTIEHSRQRIRDFELEMLARK